MANYAYLSLWFQDFRIEKGLAHLEAVLAAFPVSPLRPGFRLVVRSLDLTQSPSLEAELLASPADVRAAAAEYLHEDTVYEITAHWNLWLLREEEEWEEGPSPVEILLHGEEFDAGRFREAGHLQMKLSHEHLYLVPTGRSPQDYLRYVRENARRLLTFLRTLEKLLPLAERKLWSEGEPAFGQRVEEILGGRFPSGK
jgi:hypothetical protein